MPGTSSYKNNPDLVFDLGMFDGADTAYYLFRGHKVLSVDANPLMIEKAKLRFAKEILTGQLTLLNVGIAETPGTATFWISDQPECSSFDRAIASREGIANHPHPIDVVPLSQLFAEYGTPQYLKIDIEGNDRYCVEALRGATLPRYISVESECVGDSEMLSDEEAIAMLERLRAVGYKRFKLVNQIGWFPLRSTRVANLYARIAARQIRPSGFAFSPGATGPWGEDIRGPWLPFEKARYIYLRERHSWFSTERPLYSFWYDWHATF